jgi:hypothetical protein
MIEATSNRVAEIQVAGVQILEPDLPSAPLIRLPQSPCIFQCGMGQRNTPLILQLILAGDVHSEHVFPEVVRCICIC